MLGSLNPENKNATIIGAGISGLLAGFYLKKNGYKVKILEKQKRIGGIIKTHNTEFGMVQEGPHLVRTNLAFLNLLQELNINIETIKSKKKQFLVKDKVVKSPFNLIDLTQALFKTSFRKAKAEYKNSNDFFTYHFGAKFANKIFSAMANGIYGDDLQKLNPKIAFAIFFPPTGDSVLKHLIAKKKAENFKPSIIAPKNGFNELIEKLGVYLKDEIEIKAEIDNLDFEDNLILATPAYVSSQLLEPVDTKLATMLSQVTYTALSSCTVFLEKASMIIQPQAIGILNSQNADFLGCLYNSASFSNRVKNASIESVTLMFKIGVTDATIKKYLRLLFGSKIKILDIIRFDYPQAIPLYDDALARVIAGEFSFTKKGGMLFANYAGELSLAALCKACHDKISN